MTPEEWNVLPPEEQTKRQDEKPSESSSSSEVKEDVVIIDGKPRPLKNFMAEMTRKVKEDVLREMPVSEFKREEKPVVHPQDWQKTIVSAAEREMEETGSIIPVNTILGLINQGTQFQLNEFNKSNKQAQSMTKAVKRELRSQYKDYAEYEDEFESIIEEIDPRSVTKDGLVVLFNSLRGKHLDEILEKERETASKKAIEDKKIIGEVSSGGKKFSPKLTNKLTRLQQQEMRSMGFETEEDYLGRIEHRQAYAKSRNAKNVPDTLAERLIF